MNKITLPISASAPKFDKSAQGQCVARLTVTREVGNVTIIEVCERASFHSFYWIFTRTGRRHSTKTPVRTASRNEGLRPYSQAYRMQPGLEVLAENWKKQPGIKAVTLRIIRKRIYKQLVTCAPDVLGLTKVHVGFKAERPKPAISPFVLPKGYTPIKRRFEILTSK